MTVKHFDDIYDISGHFGPYQIGTFCLVGLVAIFPGWQNFIVNFIGPNQDHWCRVPRLQNFSHGQQKYIAIPPDGSAYSKCKVYDLNYNNFSDEELLNWNRTAVIESQVPQIDCKDYVYDRSEFLNTIVEKFGLVCSRAWMVPLVSTIYLFGHLVGAVTSGILSDRFGRKRTLLALIFVGGGTALAAAFATHYVLFVLLRMICGAVGMGSIQTGFVLMMETIGPRWRVPLSLVYHNWFACGFTLLPGVAFVVRDSFKLQIILAIPAFILMGNVLVLSESPRWLITQGRYQDAKKVLNRIAAVNGKDLPDDLDLEIMHQTSTASSEQAAAKQGTLLDLFRTPNIRYRTLIQCLNWFATSMGYYGLSLGAGNLPGGVFVNTLIAAVTQFPANFIIVFFVFKFGRRLPQVGSLITAGIFCLAAIPFVLNKDLPQWLITALAMLGKLCITASFSMVYLYAGELYPTPIRTNGVGLCSMFARVGSTLSPQVKLLSSAWPALPFLFFGAFPLIAGFLSLKLPETKGLPLPQTMEEGENLGKNPIKEENIYVNPALTNDEGQSAESTKM